MRTIRSLSFLVVAVLISACSSLESVDEITAALSPASYPIGNSSAVYTTTGWDVTYLYKDGQLPRQPNGMESTAAAWSDVWYVDNGGSCFLSPDGLTGTGDLNRVRFYVYRMNSYGGQDTYHVQVDFFYTDGNGGCTYRPNATSVTALPENYIYMTWAAGNVTLVVKNQAGQTVAQTAPYAFIFPAGVKPRVVHSPQMLVGMDTSQAYGGCMRDVPDYDDSSSDTGHWKEHNMFGASAPSFAAYLSAPTSNTHCSLSAFHDTTLFRDIVQWHVDGF